MVYKDSKHILAQKVWNAGRPIYPLSSSNFDTLLIYLPTLYNILGTFYFSKSNYILRACLMRPPYLYFAQ